MQHNYFARKKDSVHQNQQTSVSNEDMSLSEIMEQAQNRYGTLTFIVLMKIFKNHWRKIVGKRFFTMMFISAVWSFFIGAMLLRLPLEMPLHIINRLYFLPLTVSRLVANRARLRKRLMAGHEYAVCERIKNSRWIAEYDHGKYANCNCFSCRISKNSLRRLIAEYYLKAYCLRCKTKVNILNPQQVAFTNGREAISGICHICGAKVVRIGRFHGRNLFERHNS